MKYIFKTVPGISLFLVMVVSILLIAGCSNSTTTTTASAAATTAAPSTSSTPLQTQPAETASGITLNISAASSLTDAIKELNGLYLQKNSNITLTPNFAGSGTLQKQIEQGAPADVFISAAAGQMDTLQKENLILTETRKNLLNNTLVLVVPSDSTLGISSLNDLTGDAVKKIAIGDPKSVPAGTYAQQAFDKLGITARLQDKLVLGADVRGVLSYVESGNVDAGLVYLTDAKTSSKVKVAANAPDDINAKIVYPVAVVAASKVPDAAKSYVNFLFSDQARTVFVKYGFSLVGQ
jgi:molybdate transport system substrate-binding protein